MTNYSRVLALFFLLVFGPLAHGQKGLAGELRVDYGLVLVDNTLHPSVVEEYKRSVQALGLMVLQLPPDLIVLFVKKGLLSAYEVVLSNELVDAFKEIVPDSDNWSEFGKI